MNKTSKKELSDRLIKAIEEIFSVSNKEATEAMMKHVKVSGKWLAKKFNKAILKSENKRKTIIKKQVKKKAPSRQKRTAR